MNQPKRYWAPIRSVFGDFAAWVDDEGRLLRFDLRAEGAERVDPAAERSEKVLHDVQRQIAEYDSGKRKDFRF